MATAICTIVRWRSVLRTPWAEWADTVAESDGSVALLETANCGIAGGRRLGRDVSERRSQTGSSVERRMAWK